MDAHAWVGACDNARDHDETFDTPILALVYEGDSLPEAAFAQIVERCRARGMRLAGLLQHTLRLVSGRRCDVTLEDLASGRLTPLLERRGVDARGCRLDHAALTEATSAAMRSLESEPDLLIVNKFGKAELEGGGTRDLVAAALSRGVPVVIGVPSRNLAGWRAFAGPGALETPLSKGLAHPLFNQRRDWRESPQPQSRGDDEMERRDVAKHPIVA